MRATIMIIIISAAHIVTSKAVLQTDDQISRLRRELSIGGNEDIQRVKNLNSLAGFYWLNQADSGMHFAKEALLLSKKLGYSDGELMALQFLVLGSNVLGDEVKSIAYGKQMLRLAEKVSSDSTLGIILTARLDDYWKINPDEFERLFWRAYELNRNNPFHRSLNEAQMASSLMRQNRPDSALVYANAPWKP